ncbi:anti-phage dCTP deaminase [Stenotrophomonas maltophilia]|uniref:anti-phage dCTP deaminase n=1 Tax=Stenotrophomonas maltophilia TaxID=40324 RepID=UPI00163D6C5E|nr:anti-phage dCTP deaminase [Stenotrophomonas maltophilia]
MNAAIAPVGKNAPAASNALSKDASDEIRSRHSKELIIGLSGPVGCGLEHVKRVLRQQLELHGYEVVDIKVSAQFAELARRFGLPEPPDSFANEYERISAFQDLGNSLRSRVGGDLAAQLAVSMIAQDRTVKNPGLPVQEIKPGRVAYIIDQLKNPSEAILLREIYGNIFYLIGILTGYEKRKSYLSTLMGGANAEQLIERDRAESGSSGQQLEKTLKLADYFVRNDSDNTPELEAPIQRFVKLLHGTPGITPTLLERGMHAAYSASLRSACLSRQVGAAILDSDGILVSTGCNDVPKAGGGLYDESGNDQRCVFREGGICFNDKHKDRLRDEIEQLLITRGVAKTQASLLAREIRSGTRLKDLIEFSRAVHAEMDAIISAARRGGSAIQGCLLFTTTYPCHNCARHIVAAGISAVYFIEPYGKSLASELHDDAISHAPSPSPASASATGKVAFLHFEGVAPARFSSLFFSLDSRKDSTGKARFVRAEQSEKRAPELLDNYRELEAKINERLKRKVDEAESAFIPDGVA